MGSKLTFTLKFIIVFAIVANTAYISTNLLGYIMGSYIEFSYNPVMVPGELLDAHTAPNKEGFTEVSFTAIKLRDCDWKNTRWYYGDRNTSYVKVPMSHGEKPRIRNTGEQKWDRTYVFLNEESIRNESFAIAEHSCNRFWNTYSLIYESKQHNTQ